jgi:glucose-1-phosphate adenylyltransferase
VVGDAEITNSIVGLRSIIGKGCKISSTVIMGADFYEEAPRTSSVRIGIGDSSHIERAIIDKNARIGKHVVIRNIRNTRNADGPNYFIRDGIVIIPKNAVLKDGTRI